MYALSYSQYFKIKRYNISYLMCIVYPRVVTCSFPTVLSSLLELSAHKNVYFFDSYINLHFLRRKGDT